MLECLQRIRMLGKDRKGLLVSFGWLNDKLLKRLRLGLSITSCDVRYTFDGFIEQFSFIEGENIPGKNELDEGNNVISCLLDEIKVGHWCRYRLRTIGSLLHLWVWMNLIPQYTRGATHLLCMPTVSISWRRLTYFWRRRENPLQTVTSSCLISIRRVSQLSTYRPVLHIVLQH